MKQLYVFLAKHQKKIKFLFLLSYISLITLYIAGIWAYGKIDNFNSLYSELGEKLGQVTIALLTTALIPGMLKRLGILKRLSSIFILFRRQLGVLAFFTAVTHMGYQSFIEKIALGENPLTTAFTYQQTGFAAITIFFLLWVTSNDFSMKFLGKWWKYLQRTSYLAIILLILHTFDAGSKFWLVLAVILSLEAISWLVYLIKPKPENG
jgi:methionine sulfoxide reductase heme-binding subunit